MGGLTMNDAVTLLGGAHSLGHVHAANSGYSSNNINKNNINLISGWDNSPTVFGDTLIDIDRLLDSATFSLLL